MKKACRPADVLTVRDHGLTSIGIPSRFRMERDAFISAPNDRVNGKERRFLGFTQAEWVYAGTPKHDLGYYHMSLHPDLLVLGGMAEAVERWRREAASQYEGEHGPVPRFWNMPDLVGQWELMNPDFAAAHTAYTAMRERDHDENHPSWQRKTASDGQRAASGT
jgi:hypothetical protein